MWIFMADSQHSVPSAVGLPPQPKPWRHGSKHAPIVNSTLSASECFFHGNTAAKSTSHQFGQTSLAFEEPCSRSGLSLFSGLTPAKESLLLALEQAWRTSKRSFFGTFHDWPKKQKLRLFSAKITGRESGRISAPSEMRLRELDTKSGTVTLRPETSELGTSESATSCWPTPLVSRATYEKQRDGTVRPNLPLMWRLGILPTPTATPYGSNQGGAAGRKGMIRYSLEQLWRLAQIPTPRASEGNQQGFESELRRNSPSVSTYWKATTGTNMPASFLEWIQGFRIGASVLEPWAIPTRRRSTGKPFVGSQVSHEG